MLKRTLIPTVVLAGLASFCLTAAPANAASTITPTHLAYPTGGTTSVGAGTDSFNDNAQLADDVPATVARSWTNSPATCAQSAGTNAESISVTGSVTVVDEVGYQCSFVSAYATTTGALKWRHSYKWAMTATVTGGVVYVHHNDPTTSVGLVDAISVATGAVLWTGDQEVAADRTESVGSGIVINGQEALSASTGKYLFTLPLAGSASTNGTDLVADGTIFYNSDTALQAFTPAGKSVWVLPKPGGNSINGAGAGTQRPAMHGGLLYVRSTYDQPTSGTLVVNPSTGKVVRTIRNSDTDWAFDGNVGFATTTGTYDVPTTISAVNLTTGATYWTHVFPMYGQYPFSPLSAPIVENGLIWFEQGADTNSSAETLALSETSGAVQSDFSDSCAIGGGNIVVAQHRLFTSTNCGVRSWVPSTSAPVVTVPAGEVLTDPGFEKGADGWSALGKGNVARTSTARSGSYGFTVTPTSSTAGTVGFQQSTAITKAAQGSYSASCWVRPSKPGMKVGMQFDDWKGGKPDTVLPTGYEDPSMAVGTWTYMSIQGNVGQGDTLSLQVDAVNASAAGGTLTIDDCSITKVTV